MTTMTTSDWISLSGVIIAMVSAVFTGWGVWFTHKQWQKIKSKVAMINDSGKATEILPAWYTSRMMDDYWLFGLLTNDGRLIVINSISSISDDGKWMDVQLAQEDEVTSNAEKFGSPVYAIAPDRADASLRIDNIVAAIDLKTS